MLDRHRGGLARGGGGADQGVLQRAGLAVGVAGREVPGGWGDDLVAADDAAFQVQPMAQRTAGGLGQADAGPA